ncbi:recombinase family protein [Nonomuraea sp. NPDC050783]|uniref:recombinase family protein n=1 Tax=Nonomuraea sp. NPDC050783 TaxID=3154634 RepID=UPI003467AD9B
MALIGLVRVSTDEQKISGKLKTDDRPAPPAVLSHIRDGDLLAGQEADRFGRNLLDGLIVLSDLFERGIGVTVLEGIAAGEHSACRATCEPVGQVRGESSHSAEPDQADRA